MKTVTILYPTGRTENVALKEVYRGFNIVTYLDSEYIMVHDPRKALS